MKFSLIKKGVSYKPMINVTLKDGSVRRYEPGTSLLEMAFDISPRLAKETLVAKVNGKLTDLNEK